MKEEIVELIINGEAVSAKSRGLTARNLLTSLGVSFGLYILYVLLFSILRKRMQSVYEPRTFIVAKHLRIPTTSNAFFGWISPIYSTPLKDIPRTVGLDAYFFLRYLLLVMLMCGAMALIMIPTLLPLHVTSERADVEGMDRLSISNISEEDTNRHIAHLVLCMLSVAVSLFMFKRELMTYFRIRAEHLVNQGISPSSSTLLIKRLHPDYMESESKLREFYSGLSTHLGAENHAVKRIWFNHDYTKLHSLVNEQSRILEKLEGLELWLIQLCLGIGTKSSHRENTNVQADKLDNITGSLWRRHLSDADKALVDGYRGDLLIALKSELSGLNSLIMNMRANSDLFPKVDSCFIEFDCKLSCFSAARSMGAGHIISPGHQVFDRVYPADIIWSSLSTPTWVEQLCRVGAVVLNYLFVFGWAFPIAFLSAITQVEMMARWMPEVQWLLRIPRVTQLMTSVVSPLIMSGLTAQVPTIFRYLSRMKGFPTNTLVEMDVQKYLFLFLFFQLFLIVTLATGLPSLIVKIMLNTSEGAITLASSLPKASTFFISYLIASSLTAAGDGLLQTQQLILRAWDHCFTMTPRQKLRSMCRYSMLYWGSLFPLATHVGSIAIAYSLINPIILLSATLGCGALFIAYKYRILYCYVPRCIADGDYYPRAIFQLFSGVYCQEISLLGTLLVSRQVLFAFIVSALLGTITVHHRLHRLYLDMNNRIPLPGAPAAIISDDFEAQRASCNGTMPRSKSSSDGVISLPRSSGLPFSPTPHERSTSGSVEHLASPCSVSTRQSIVTLVEEDPTLRARITPEIQSGATAAVKDAWLGIFDALATDFSSLDADQQEHIANEMFQHPECRGHRPCVWIPKDQMGVAADQVAHMQGCLSDMKASCSGASIDDQGKITVTLAPPDFESREIMRI